MSTPMSTDLTFEKVWPGNTTPVAVDGTGAAGRNVCGYVLYNAAAAARFVRLFDIAVAPTMGTSIARLVIPLATITSQHIILPRPIWFSNGLWVSITTGIADNDNTAPAASDVLVNILYN